MLKYSILFFTWCLLIIQPVNSQSFKTLITLNDSVVDIGYDFSGFFRGKFGVLINTTAQNLFTVSAYKGPEYEIVDGIDYGIYPSPSTFLLGIKLGIN